MNETEILAKATIAAALIASHVVETPTIPKGGSGVESAAAIRLRELTDYVYETITGPAGSARPLQQPH
jgi:hypothetical protein